LRRTGTTLQWLAVIPVIIAALVLYTAWKDDDDGSTRLGAGPSTSTSTTTPDATTTTADVSVSTATTLPVAGAEVLTDGVNEAPVVIEPEDGTYIPGERVAVIGLSVQDAEAEADGGAIAVLLISPTSGVHIDLPATVQTFGAQGWGWFPMIGPVRDINAALATLELEPIDEPDRLTLSILASDLGHGDEENQKGDSGFVAYFPA
jgi:hypothetical protein